MSVAIDDIITDKEQKSYWIHRTSISPLFINYNSQQNGKPVLLSIKEFINMEDVTNICQLPIDLWQEDKLEEYSTFIEFLLANGITKEMYMSKNEANYLEQLQDYFNNGLYSQRLDITTTATKIDDDDYGKSAEKNLEKILKQSNFGFAAGNSILGALSNRGDLNLLFVLEIPKECFSVDDLQKLFEQTQKVLERDTAYFGIQSLDKVIPPQYIKCAIISSENDFETVFNPRYDNKYVIQDGVYDEARLNERIENACSQPFDYGKALEIIKQINNNLKYNKSYSLYKVRTDKLLEMIYQNFDIDDRSYELYDKLLLAQEEVRKSMRTPLEAISEDLISEDVNSMTEQELTEKISNLLSVGTASLNENIGNYDLYFSEFEAFEKGLEAIDESVLSKISSSSKFNDIVGNVNTKKKLIEMFYAEKSVNEKLISERLTMETAQDELIVRENLNNNRVYMIKKALASSDMNVANQIINYMNINDIASLSIEDCDNIIETFGQGFKPSDGVKER